MKRLFEAIAVIVILLVCYEVYKAVKAGQKAADGLAAALAALNPLNWFKKLFGSSAAAATAPPSLLAPGTITHDNGDGTTTLSDTAGDVVTVPNSLPADNIFGINPALFNN